MVRGGKMDEKTCAILSDREDDVEQKILFILVPVNAVPGPK